MSETVKVLFLYTDESLALALRVKSLCQRHWMI